MGQLIDNPCHRLIVAPTPALAYRHQAFLLVYLPKSLVLAASARLDVLCAASVRKDELGEPPGTVNRAHAALQLQHLTTIIPAFLNCSTAISGCSCPPSQRLHTLLPAAHACARTSGLPPCRPADSCSTVFGACALCCGTRRTSAWFLRDRLGRRLQRVWGVSPCYRTESRHWPGRHFDFYHRGLNRAACRRLAIALDLTIAMPTCAHEPDLNETAHSDRPNLRSADRPTEGGGRKRPQPSLQWRTFPYQRVSRRSRRFRGSMASIGHDALGPRKPKKGRYHVTLSRSCISGLYSANLLGKVLAPDGDDR